MKKNSAIDVVITWVDGSEPKHKQKIEKFLNTSKQHRVSGAHTTRFESVNEIKYCVLSILKFAPFVRKIFIVTDGQNPKLDKDIKTLFPNRLKDVQIIDHKEIFEGYEEFLPTFNSLSIETFMWRIKGLADNFVYFNDDLFLVRTICPEDWFRNGSPVMRGQWKSRPSILLLRKRLLNQIKKGIFQIKEPNLHPVFKISQYWIAEILGFKKKYFRTAHTPNPLNKLRLEQFFKEHKNIFIKNASYRLRHYSQYNTVALANHIEISNNNSCFETTQEVYLKPVNKGPGYITKKLAKWKKNKEIKFMCVQSLDMATKKDRERILQWLENNLKSNNE
ncbi:MAG: Stealth CR1 domain-containing protein [Polaribacter sp.]|nr:Stealth CR1 domain-containing protein [Polaribacter sp.]